jgi:Protein of unknown function (DUF2905)
LDSGYGDKPAIAAAAVQAAVRIRDQASMQKGLIVLGIVIALIGVAWPWVSKLPIGRLPGDILIDRPGFRVFFPITTLIIISVVISLILMLFRK